jgi:CheY-like chemotaxis protein
MSLCNGVVRILYVEDNEDIARVFATLMRLMVEVNAEVLLAADGEEGVEMALREKPDIVFMDEELPVLSGIEATRRIRAGEGLSDVPVAMVSAHLSDAGRAERAREAGVTHWVEKPFESEDLENTLRSALGLSPQ